MEEGFRITTINKEKIRSILKMVDTNLEMIKTIDSKKFTSQVIKEYYEVIRELLTTILLLDGLKTEGEGAHKRLIDYLADKHKNVLNRQEIFLLDELRSTRNKISYDGFFVSEEYFNARKDDIQRIILKLKTIINREL